MVFRQNVEGLNDDTKQRREVNDDGPALLQPCTYTLVIVLMGL